MKTIRSLFLTWLCLASAEPSHLTKKENQYFLVGVGILSLTGLAVLTAGLSLISQ